MSCLSVQEENQPLKIKHVVCTQNNVADFNICILLQGREAFNCIIADMSGIKKKKKKKEDRVRRHKVREGGDVHRLLDEFLHQFQPLLGVLFSGAKEPLQVILELLSQGKLLVPSNHCVRCGNHTEESRSTCTTATDLPAP